MNILIEKYTSEINIQQAITFEKELPKTNNKFNDVRFIKSENIFYIFNGMSWQGVNLIINN